MIGQGKEKEKASKAKKARAAQEGRLPRVAPPPAAARFDEHTDEKIEDGLALSNKERRERCLHAKSPRDLQIRTKREK